MCAARQLRGHAPHLPGHGLHVGVGRARVPDADRGLRRSADGLNISNWRTARAGESSFAGRGVDAPLGTQVLWGNEVSKHPEMGGRSFAQLTASAATPLDPNALNLPPEKARVDPHITHNNGMRTAATTLGVTRNVLPPAEFTRSLQDQPVKTT